MGLPKTGLPRETATIEGFDEPVEIRSLSHEEALAVLAISQGATDPDALDAKTARTFQIKVIGAGCDEPSEAAVEAFLGDTSTPAVQALLKRILVLSGIAEAEDGRPTETTSPED